MHFGALRCQSEAIVRSSNIWTFCILAWGATTLWSLVTTHFCWFVQVDGSKSTGRYYKGVELCWLADTTCTLVSGWHLPSPVNRCWSWFLISFEMTFQLNWKWIRFGKRRLPEGNILCWWAIVIGRRSFVILWICLQVLSNCKAIRPSAVADSGDTTNWFWLKPRCCVSKD